MTHAVVVQGLDALRAGDRKVVLHGVNKSGSLAMTNVLHGGYHDARRANQFFSTYRSVPRDVPHLIAILTRSTGHSFFGGHYLYGAVPLTPDEHVLTTQFRNPLPRVRSCYQWLRNKADAAGERYPEFERWVERTRGVRHSQVAQFALGYAPGAQAELQTVEGEELLERALVNIERDVQWFGIAEFLEESAFCMAAICGIPRLPAWRRDDRNANRPLVDEWPAEHRELVRDVFRWDFMLYEWAVDRFHQRISELEFGPELDEYKAACVDQYKDRLAVDGEALSG